MSRKRTDDIPPGRLRRAVATFEGFHEYPVRDISAFDSRLEIPSVVYVPGPCKWVTYRSDKWNKGTYDYIHEIDSYPRVAIGYAKPTNDARQRSLPARATADGQVFNRIGKCLGWAFASGDEVIEASPPSGCEWWWSPSGKILVAIRSRRTLVAVVWGGKLDVEDRGIVG